MRSPASSRRSTNLATTLGAWRVSGITVQNTGGTHLPPDGSLNGMSESVPPPSREERRPGGRTMWLLSGGHAVDDLYQGSVPALIPFFVAARHWDYAAASGITVAATVLSSGVH